ncbi:MAG: tRNA preQ1(34) S-adenosylmethionine ribosyltransferase-isomerase QueA [Terriglobales bacterium]|jgi:S-adenosylmethionine:tRNA ribosyltransferase-isomerase
MLVSDFHYDLPPGRIAQEPLPDRAASRLLRVNRPNQYRLSGDWQDGNFREFPDLLRPDDLLVLNNTRVFPARLYGHRSGQRAQPLAPRNPAARDFLRGSVEVLLTRQVADHPMEWQCLVRPGRKIGIGEKLYFGGASASDASFGGSSSGTPPALEAEVVERGSFGERRIRFAPVPDFFARVERIGHVPLPPYIDRADRAADRNRYQTVYAQARGSVAAPTAGLHFTPEILDHIRQRGIEIAEITLHVGLGTFQPVRVEKVEDHKLHRESYEISAGAARAINRAMAENRRVVAVGTTTVRTLEYAAGLAVENAAAELVEPGRGEADAFIYPGHRFRIVNALLTNFHLPQSTLLMLVCAFGGKDLVMSAYRHAVDAGYRFYSYGDCMFVE